MSPWVMVLLDFDYGRVVMLKVLLAHMLTASSLIIAKHWKAQVEVTLADWIMKVRYMALVNKLMAINRFTLGKMNVLKEYELEWHYFFQL